MNGNYNLVMIRHAQSIFNQSSLKFAQQMKIQFDWWGLIKNSEFNKKVTYNRLFCNATLSEHGQQQCKKVEEKTKNIDIGVILVSPYFRALKTCHNLFNSHSAPIFVEPLLSEIFRYSCDVVHPLEQYQQKFPKFNFGETKLDRGDWYLSHLPKQTQQQIEQAFKQHQSNSIEEQQDIILRLMSEGKLKQEYGDFKKRIDKAKLVVKEYQNKYGKVAIVAHYHTIAFMKAKEFTQAGNIATYPETLNCHPYYEDIDNLL